MDSTADIADEKLLALIPRQVAKDLGEAPRCGCEQLEGALLFVDIAGFSSIASQLQKFQSHGEGSETLSLHLNEFFSRLIAIVREMDGDIIFFSGDAMMVAWSEGTIEASCAACVQCGAALLARTPEYTFSLQQGTEPVTCTMKLHIGGSGGIYQGLTVGGKGHPSLGKYKYFLTGEPVEICAIAASLGTHGQFLICSYLLEQATRYGLTIDTSLREEEYGGKEYSFEQFVEFSGQRKSVVSAPLAKLAPLSDLAKMNASMYIFDTVIKSVTTTQCNALRTVCTIFMQLTSIDVKLPPDKLHRSINTAVGIVQHELARYGGVLNKVMLDDKGVILLCLFGIPLHAHQNDASRAVHVSVKSVKRLKAHGIIASIGISRAPVFCGITGSIARHEYTVLGGGVNLSARLMTKAADFGAPQYQHIMVDSSIAHSSDLEGLCVNGYAILDGDCFMLKGLIEPVHCYHLICEADRDAVLNHIQDLEEGRPLARCASMASMESKGDQTVTLINRSATLQLLKIARDAKKLPHSSLSGSSAPSRQSIVSVESETSDPSLKSEGGKVGWFNRAGSEYMQKMVESGLPTRQSSTASSVTSEQPRGWSLVKKHQHSISAQSEQHNFKRGRGKKVVQASRSSSDLSGSDFGGSFSVEESGQDPIGRSPLIEKLKSHLDQWIRMTSNPSSPASVPRLLIIRGEKKLGLSLIMERVCSGCTIPVAMIKGSESAEIGQYHSLRYLLRQMLLETDMVSLLEKLPDETLPLLPLLRYVQRYPELPALTQEMSMLPVTEKEQKIAEIVVALLKSHYGPYVVLAVDDVQWLDSTSLQFLRNVRSDPSVFCFMAQRLEPLHAITKVYDYQDSDASSSCSSQDLSSDDEPVALASQTETDLAMLFEGGDPKPVTMDVPLINIDHAEEMICSLTGASFVDPHLVAKLYAKTDGLPGYLIEMTKSLKANNMIKVDLTGTARHVVDTDLEDGLTQLVSQDMEASVMAIVDGLSTVEKRVACIAAVFGKVLPYRLLIQGTSAESISREEAEKAVEVLVQIGLVTQVHGEEEQMVTFAKQLHCDILYSSLLARERRRLHYTISQLMEGRPHPHLPSLTHHYIKAKQVYAGWCHIDRHTRSLIEHGSFEEPIKMLAEMLTCKTRGATASPRRAIAPDENLRSYWILSVMACLYETGQFSAAEDNSLLHSHKAELASSLIGSSRRPTDASQSASQAPQNAIIQIGGDTMEHSAIINKVLQDKSMMLNLKRKPNRRPSRGPNEPARPEDDLAKILGLNSGDIFGGSTSVEQKAPPTSSPPKKKPSKRKSPQKKMKKKTGLFSCCFSAAEEPTTKTSTKYHKKEEKEKKSKPQKKTEPPPPLEAFCAGTSEEIPSGKNDPDNADPPHIPMLLCEALPQQCHMLPRPSIMLQEANEEGCHSNRGSFQSAFSGGASYKGSYNGVDMHQHFRQSVVNANCSPLSEQEIDRQIRMCRAEVAFWKGDISAVAHLQMVKKMCIDPQSRFAHRSIEYALDIMEGTELSRMVASQMEVEEATPPVSLDTMLLSPFTIMAVAGMENGLTLLEKLPTTMETLTHGSEGTLNILPLQEITPMMVAPPRRPSLMLTALVVKVVLQVFKGSVVSAFDDCLRLKELCYGDNRSQLYAAILRSYVQGYFSSKLADEHFALGSDTAVTEKEKKWAQWRTLTKENILQRADNPGEMQEDAFLRLLWGAQESVKTGELFLNKSGGLITPCHILAMVVMAEEALNDRSAAEGIAHRFVNMLGLASASYPFARAAYHCFSGQLRGSTTDYELCITLSITQAEGSIPKETGFTPFSFRSAVQILCLKTAEGLDTVRSLVAHCATLRQPRAAVQVPALKANGTKALDDLVPGLGFLATSLYEVCRENELRGSKVA